MLLHAISSRRPSLYEQRGVACGLAGQICCYLVLLKRIGRKFALANIPRTETAHGVKNLTCGMSGLSQ